jgi:hypothetical protein
MPGKHARESTPANCTSRGGHLLEFFDGEELLVAAGRFHGEDGLGHRACALDVPLLIEHSLYERVPTRLRCAVDFGQMAGAVQ